ncbi:MAG: tyrosine-type recombinase/integrase [Candidatus Erginobacter occultus]|nr:tyrosine-type recombinase/integrase [Candidatus Erginobacter occultus]
MKPRIQKIQVKHFTVSEETKFRQAVEERGNPRDNLIFNILFDTGLRLGELTALNVGDVAGKDYLTVVGKGRKERTIPIGAVDGLRDKIETFLQWKRGHGEDVHPRSTLF